MAFLWQDNSTVHLLSTVHNLDLTTSWVEKLRRKPRDTSTNAVAARKPFAADEHSKLLAIPKIDDDYNQYMGGVDIADQLRSYFTTQRIARWNWQPFFYWLLHTAIINSYRLARTNGSKALHRKFRSSLIVSLLTMAQKPTPTPQTCPHKLKFNFIYKRRYQLRLRNPVRHTYITKTSSEPQPIGGKGTLLGHVLIWRTTGAWCLWCRWQRKNAGPGVDLRIRQVKSECQRCHVVLCRPCFPFFHGIGNS